MINIQTGIVLDSKNIIKLPDNALLKVRPDLWEQWDFKKNDELGLDVWKITKGSHKKVWWICRDCNSDYFSSIYNRMQGRSCPYCAGKKVNHTNCLMTLNPQLASEWHPTLNGDLTPCDVTCSSGKKAWWICELGHEWEIPIWVRSKGYGCPYCSGRYTLKGFNDMWTTKPELAKLLVDSEDGHRYTQCSVKKVDWKCPDCNHIIKGIRIGHVNEKGLSCGTCSDGISFGEKIVYNLMKQMGLDFKWNKSLSWSKKYRYDFYFEESDVRCIVEVHGVQHYKDIKRNGTGSLLKEQLNDKQKYELAIENGIENYIVIDARYSDFEYIKNNILSSRLAKLKDLSNVDWRSVLESSSKSLVKDACNLWNDGDKSTKSIANKLNIVYSTVIKYLKQGAEIQWCDYNTKISRSINHGKGNSRKVVQLDLDLNFIKEWDSVKEASKSVNVDSSALIRCLKDVKCTSRGYKWIYSDNYNQLVKINKFISEVDV